MVSCEAPPIIPSSSHKVLFQLPITFTEGSQNPLEGSLKPFPLGVSKDVWDDTHVKMPHSSFNIDPITRKKIWDIVHEKFQNIPKNLEQLCEAIRSFNKYSENEISFIGLETFLNHDLSPEENTHFFKILLPKIIALALSLPEEITQPIPLLTKGSQMSLSLSQKQIGILLANAFLCTFPARPTDGDKCGFQEYADINFDRLHNRQDVHTKEKYRCIFNYFSTITSNDPLGVVTFTRSSPEIFDFGACDKPLPDLKMDLEGVIEEAADHLQVDFADMYVGGMIFTKGCVQEEIRFLLCPELIVSRLFTTVLTDSDALIVTGVEQYNKSKGYGRSFKFNGPFTDTAIRDDFGRKRCQLVAIDALNFNRRTYEQYKSHFILREIQKAFAGYLPEEGTRKPYTPIATGNWGCGVFRGNPKLKSLIQVVAAGAADRDVRYFAFGNKKLVSELGSLSTFLKNNNVTVGELTKILLSYSNEKSKIDGKDLYDFIRLKIQQEKRQ